MKRFHVHVAVADLAASVRFYSTLFGGAPTVRKDDYAKWQLDDPRVNFAISARGAVPGLDHLGLQTDNDEELGTLHAPLQAANVAAQAEHEVACCYARSNKYWVTDPTGIARIVRSLDTLALLPAAFTIVTATGNTPDTSGTPEITPSRLSYRNPPGKPRNT